jgi:hypothetical protein
MWRTIAIVVVVVGSAGPALAQAVASAPQPRNAMLSEMTLQGTVQAVDHAARTVTIRGSMGNVVTLDVPATVARFDQVKVGDTISATYYDVVNLRPKPAGEPDVDRTGEATTPTPGALPGATVAQQRVSTVTITAWDPATRTVSFTGPKGTAYTRRLADTLDPSIVAGLKVGDRVDVTRTEAVRISMQSAAPAPAALAPADDDFRHRFSIAVQWGVDNSFSGHMIQSASGQTARGVPINLNETDFDDVYGRMGLFKVGAGYRISPRSEAVLNFVISRSSAETVDIGTVGNLGGAVGARPLLVDFDDYNYWGFEGGQRFYFARVRFTPFLGYLVGINRYDDIRGTIQTLPPDLTPGLAAQDGKFFEKAWAFSFGPTGGVLVGLGPIEVMGEVQFRYMGGLSDVDWLVEEGLRDINSESSRWSFPILIGARLRF